MTWYALPAALALLFKLYLIISKRHLINENAALYYLVFVFAINNFTEYLILTSGGVVESGFLVRAYYPTAIAVLIYGLIYSIGSNKLFVDKILIAISTVFGVALALAILTSDYVVLAGMQKSYFVTAVRGEYYYITQIFVLLMCSLIAYVVVRNFRNSKDEAVRVEALWVMLAVAPSLFITFSCVILMILKFNINALIFTPIGSTLFLIITLISSNKGVNKKDPRKYIPLTLEKEFSKEIANAENAFLTGGLSLPEFESEVSKAASRYASSKAILDSQSDVIAQLEPTATAKSQREVMQAQAQLMQGNATYSETIATIETAIVDSLIAEHGGNISKASREFGVDRAMIYRKKTKTSS